MTPETKNFLNLFTFDQSIQAMQKWINDNPAQWQECLKDDWQIVLEFIRSCKSLDWLDSLEKNGIKIPPQTNQNFWLGLEG
ncbi:MAG: hypothetical protein P4L79_17700 [Legionella sp.]|uniref:hypothetical protein n=1 Tax=Legionella sp. TaxID=459 RepID=UPI0028412F7B|nr:hypothetical protein [Legionella sp.]